MQLGAAEEFILTVTDSGYGKRTSAYDYRLTGRGGQGLIAHNLARGGKLAASFPVDDSDEILLVTDGGQLIAHAGGANSYRRPQHPRGHHLPHRR